MIGLGWAMGSTTTWANSDGELAGDAASVSYYLDVLPVTEPAHIGWNGSVDVGLRSVSQLFAYERGFRGRTKQ